MKILKISIPLILLFLLLFSCAVREAPSGGPEDKTAPAIVEISPPSGSTMLSPGVSFTIFFSKPMQKENTENAIYISPLFWGYPVFEWSGNKKLTITPPEKLRENATYNVTIGAGVTDLRGNKLGKSQSFAFSTGAAIDSGSISGAIYLPDQQRQLYNIWAYLLDDTTLSDFWLGIPDYATQVDSIGGFKIDNLGNGRYFIIAIDDKNGDLFWDPSAEAIGLPPGLISLQSEERLHGLVFRPERRDTSIAVISRVTPINENLLAIELSQPVDKKKLISLDSYIVKYSEGDSVLGTGQVYLGEGNSLILETVSQVPGRNYRLIPHNLWSIWGNPFDTTGYRFVGVATLDTVGPKFLGSFPSDGSRIAYQDTAVELTFSERIRVLAFPEAVKVIADSTDTLQFIPVWTSPNIVRLRFPAGIPRQKLIEIRLDPKKITDNSRNPMPDSSLRISFRLPPADTIGAIETEIGSKTSYDVVGVLSQMGREVKPYQAVFNRDGRLEFKAVMPGLYHFEYYEDADKNDQWSPGSVKPFIPAEKFGFLADTISVRSRWTSEIGSVSLPSLP